MELEEDFKLFKFVRTNPINSCVDLSKNMIGKRNGIFYFTERFRIDFENKMSELNRLEKENEYLKAKLDEINNINFPT
jgi:hypothetical protein